MPRKRKRFRDKSSCGKSSVVPFKQQEDWRSRHRRRYQVAHEMQTWLEAWCAANGFELAVKNNGHHWIITDPSGTRCEWWPSSAKFIYNQKWTKGIHCHDAKQLTRLIQEQLSKR